MRAVFARHYDQVMARMEKGGLGEARAALLEGLAGRVVEIGAGTGRNLPHYPATVRHLVLTEPSPVMRDHLRTRLAELAPPFEVEIVDATAERLPLNDDSADAIVSTLVLCSVPALGPAVAELRRVLRPGGELRLIEHVAAEGGWVKRVQRAIDPAWNWLEGSCHLDHETRTALAAGGFDVSRVEAAESPMPLPMVRGVAVAPA